MGPAQASLVQQEQGTEDTVTFPEAGDHSFPRSSHRSFQHVTVTVNSNQYRTWLLDLGMCDSILVLAFSLFYVVYSSSLKTLFDTNRL